MDAEGIARIVRRDENRVTIVDRHTLDMRARLVVTAVEVELDIRPQIVGAAKPNGAGKLGRDEVHIFRAVPGFGGNRRRRVSGGRQRRRASRSGGNDGVLAGTGESRQVARDRLHHARARRETAGTVTRKRRGAPERAPIVCRRRGPVDGGEGVSLLIGRGNRQRERAAGDAVGQREIADRRVGIEGVLVGQSRLGAGIVSPQDNVDHAGERVGAINGRSAVGEDFDPLDRCHRDASEIVAVATTDVAGAGDAAAIDEDERARGPESAKVYVGALGEHAGGRTVGNRGLPLRLTAKADTVVRALGKRLRNETGNLAHVGETGLLDLLPTEADDGAEIRLAEQPADARAGDFDRVDGDGALFLLRRLGRLGIGDGDGSLGERDPGAHGQGDRECERNRNGTSFHE